jgi:hypothetical protein
MKRNQLLGLGLAGLLGAGLFAVACGSSESETTINSKADSGVMVDSGTLISIGDAGDIPCDPFQIKGATCPVNGFVCKKNCGPTNSGGRKTETCVDGVFVEGTCTFPPGDYSCYKVDGTTPECTTVNGGLTVMATDLCDMAKIGTCKPCTGYQDSKGTPKQGYCHCYLNPNPIEDDTADAGPPVPKWTCGSISKEWPCNPDGTPVSEGTTGCF